MAVSLHCSNCWTTMTEGDEELATPNMNKKGFSMGIWCKTESLLLVL